VVAVLRERQSPDCTAMALEHARLPARNLPEAQRLILRARRNMAAIRGECYGIHPFAMTGEFARVPARYIPEAKCAVLRARDEMAPVLGKGYGPHRAEVSSDLA